MGKFNFWGEFLGTKKYKINKLSYEEYWKTRRKNRGKLRVKRRDLLIKELIEPRTSVLDVGCGDGRLLHFLKTTNHNICTGVDISQRAIKLASELQLNVLWVKDLEKFLNNEAKRGKKYDYVVFSEFLEHINDPETIMKMASKIFRKAIIITFPNIGHLSYRLRLLFGKFPECWKWHPGEHVRFWTKSDFCSWIKRENNNFPSLKIEVLKSIEGTPILEKISDNLFSYNFIAKITR
ncbi:MAG: class I SAM-dependent methyltransferase [Microgenomates group bacterium]